MAHVNVLPKGSIGRGFIPPEYLPKGKDEFYLRNLQFDKIDRPWRHLKAEEIEILVKNGNTAEGWDGLLVTDPFDPNLIHHSEFYGLIRIGALRDVVLEHHDLRVPTGITHSKIIACDLGDDVAVHDVRYLAHYIIGDRCILANIDEMHTTDHAKFGNGILKEGEPEEVRIWLDVMNETGSRRILPFDGMITGDAYLWARYRDDTALQKRLFEMTQARFDPRRGYYGMVGKETVIKNSRILKDVLIGDSCYIKGANKLKNLTINSSDRERTQIGEGVELVNGIIGFGCHIFYGCKAVRFILGNNSNLKYGARLIHSFLGDNSTISCCEVLNNLIFPAHEQHHNNSFLIASVVKGQSNMAAGATIGSNHNSRANDSEVEAGRGFWPGLCTSVKHSSRFASFVLLSKGDYPAELDVPLPFSLLSNNVSQNRLEVIPAFWWIHNMYALARNSWKYRARDKRITKVQHIEFDALAPDTVEELFLGRRLLELWTSKAWYHREGKEIPEDEETLVAFGKKLLSGPDEEVAALEVLGEKMEKSSRKVLILKPHEGYRAYGEMILYYAFRQLVDYLESHPAATLESLHQALGGARRQTRWVNLGGQLIPEEEVDRLRKEIGAGRITTWEEIHARYDALWEVYPLEKQKHAYRSWCDLLGTEVPTQADWAQALRRSGEIQCLVRDRVYASRKKDYENPFRWSTYRNTEEMRAALGTVDQDRFVQQIREETELYLQKICTLEKRLIAQKGVPA